MFFCVCDDGISPCATLSRNDVKGGGLVEMTTTYYVISSAVERSLNAKQYYTTILVYPLYSPTTSLSYYTPFILVLFNELPHFHYSLILLSIRPLSPPIFFSLPIIFITLIFIYRCYNMLYLCLCPFFLPQVRGSLDFARDDGTQ